VVIEGEEEYEVEKILNKRKFRGKDRYLVQWKGYMAEEDTWEPRENLGNAKDLVKRFKEEYSKEVGWTKSKNIKEDRKGKLLGKYMAKLLYRWDDKRFNREYWEQLEKNWSKWKEKSRLERIKEEEREQELGKSRIEEWDEEDELGNLWDPYKEL